MIRYWRSEYLRTRGLPEAMGLVNQGQRQAFFKLYAVASSRYAANREVRTTPTTEYQAAAQGPAHRASRGGGRPAAEPGLDAARGRLRNAA